MNEIHIAHSLEEAEAFMQAGWRLLEVHPKEPDNKQGVFVLEWLHREPAKIPRAPWKKS
jgi:hypothetical protein